MAYRPRQRELDERWSERFEALREFVAESGQFPRYRTYTSETEHSLGIWLHNQHQRRTEGKLAAWRRDALDHEFAGWRGYS
ncbi:helicase associated domain-containing protein [Glutamicibacter nicotianae]|uniref:helicase associated domain-containing protein n=1 Tax=Glutamicibacter nicotianae TaxID=37929 RepID=UPI000EF87308